jgi:hypothetical protein
MKHAALCQFKTRKQYLHVIKQIQAIAGQPVTGIGCSIVHDPSEAYIE